EIVNGNFGITPPGGTGAKNLQLPFVSGGAQPYEIIRRPRLVDPSGVAPSREYNLAQIHVLLSDDPADLPGGAGDVNNVRLANVAPYNPFGIAASFPGGLPVLAAGNSYNTYFAQGSSAIPDNSSCTAASAGGPTCPPLLTTAAATPLPFDWPLAPAAPGAGAATLVPAGAPIVTAAGAPGPVVSLCPPGNLSPPYTPPAGCPTTNPPYPYEVTSNLDKAATWNMLDGYLRVEYKDAAGAWHAVTNEWLQLGFARGPQPPNAPGANPIHPNAILILQQPADRNGDGVLDANGLAPVCTHTVASGVNQGKCDQWNYGRPPEVIKDAGSNNPYVELTAGGVNTGITRNNWYPINFYDTREGEPRDVAAGNNSCTAAGMLNAIEIDTGNLKRWLWGNIGVNGPNVDFQAQNGWVLYFSDRRGMLPNPNPPYNGAEKSGDSGLEDVINTASAGGVPDGVLEPIPAGKKYSPEDANQNKRADFFGPANIGLGFYNGGVNINQQIVAAAPDNPYLPRITSCLTTGRKNWVSGARHVLKLVDGSLGNVPLRTDNTGGFTVASENPVYVQGNYNSNAGDPAWAGGADLPGHAAAAVIADTVTLLSNNWSDLNSMANPTAVGNRPAVTSYYRLAIAGGKNMNFPKPAWGSNDYGTDGGTHNFLRYLESWGGALNYKGSLVSLYYSTYNTGVFKCCTTVYSPPTRNYSFDADFALPSGLPPGTPLFRDVDTLGYRQLFTARTY
ncbi:MAG TPA: hypothetical protein VNY05_05070, partial [Candidatus Acidoferrales bacterium]|nr:hypothetical protein [Candidatus Acidoferrales bacterium]